jgi:phage shock protein C
MYCAHCGAQIADGTKFCAQCGAAASGTSASGKLVRPLAGRKIAGVCAAFANAYGWDLTVVRIVTLLLALCGCGGVVAYLVAWACIPGEVEG